MIERSKQNRGTFYFRAAIVAVNAAVFVPMIGHGFIHDDFVHMRSARFDSLWDGLTKAVDGPFYAPLQWLTFRADVLAWGQNPFPMAAENLLIHIAVILLVYLFVSELWHSENAACWAAVAYSVLLPANIWATMWISTRAHLLATMFSLAALCLTLYFLRMPGRRLALGFGVVVATGLAVFSKESGVIAPILVATLMIYEPIENDDRRGKVVASAILLAVLFTLVALYLVLRSQSGAMSVSADQNAWYTYSLSGRVLLANLGEYSWRTFGISAVLAGGLVIPILFRSGREWVSHIRWRDLAFSAVMFAITIAPVILLKGRSGIYTYFAGIWATTALAAVVRQFPESEPAERHSAIINLAPVSAVVAVLIGFTIGQSRRWVIMAETSSSVMRDIGTETPLVSSGSTIRLTYASDDAKNRFPDCFAAWGLEPAVQLLYGDPTLKANIVKDPGEASPADIPGLVGFRYSVENGRPGVQVLKLGNYEVLP